ncbi:unnamed protein product [Orchesella dallaii]|uniref:Chitin-binding type-2 domain-containing protein n=1 Tax=Orchesella dallaii TaxID=48710 RepID=A0ABP1R967_9HEXA
MKKLSSSKLIWGIIILLHFLVQAHCISYNCEVVGKYPDPEDDHRYHQCFWLYGTLVYLHNVCPLKTCFNDTIKYCNKESCQDYVSKVSKSYDCSTRDEKSYPCTEAGYFADPKDGSYYYKCVQVRAPDGELEWESWCYTCHSIDKTCFSNALKTCIPCGKGGATGGGGGNTGGGGTGGGGTGGGGTAGGDGKPTLTYNCKGYNALSFPCGKHATEKSTGEAYIGMFENPGDESTYYQCYYKGGKASAVCTACNKENHEVYHIDMKKCIPNKIHPTPPPKPNTKPYDCSTRTLTSYPCTKGGFVADPTDNTVFYQCVQKGTDWESRCYSCNSKLKTCYNNVLKACISCDYNEGDGHGTGGTNGGGTNGGIGGGGTGGPSTTTYDCDGYGGFSIPCQQLGSGTHAHPGDTSVYFNCAKKGKKDVAECKSCNKAKEQTYNILSKKCEAPHGHGIVVSGTIKPYDCSGYTSKSYPCSKKGYFPHPKDPTVYFHCYTLQTDKDSDDGGGLRLGLGLFGTGAGIQIGGDSLLKVGAGISPLGIGGALKIGGSDKKTVTTQKWLSKCYICNSQKKSCFKEDVQRCVNGCENGGSSLSYDCSAYNEKVTPETSCDALKKKGQKFFGLFGDRSVYFQCVKIKGKWYYYCFQCTPRSCYDQEKQICVLGTCDKKPKSKPSGRMLEGVGMEIPASEQSNEAANPHPKKNQKTRCSKYAMKSYHCINEGYFPYPEDPTVYFNCTRGNNGTLISKCRICNQLMQGCFNNDTQSCAHGCGLGLGNYDCSETPGLINTALSCADYHSRGQKYFGISADKSVYFECEKIGETWYHNCIECPSNQCFDQHKQQCEACHGYFADPKDGSYYYKCIQVRAPDGELEWESWCYTCHSIDKTCFSNALKACVPCGKGGSAGGGKPKLTYNCKGYNELSFPCDQHATKKSTGDAYIGMFENPGDESTYYQCYYKGGKAGAVCATCDKKKYEVYSIDMKKCITGKHAPPPTTPKPPPTTTPKPTPKTTPKPPPKTTPKPPPKTTPKPPPKTTPKPPPTTTPKPPPPKPKPYDCSTRTLTSFPCTKGGYVADPNDSTVFYLCAQKGSNWESRCYSCNSKKKTCYNNILKACVSCDYKGTGGGSTGGGGSGTGGPSTTTYDCGGYGGFSIPCQQLGSGTHAHPGDTSVYFNCAKKGGKDVAECMSCNQGKEEIYNIRKKKCESQGIVVTGTVKPYDCSGYTSKSYPCSKEGYFPHPKDPTVYFHCFGSSQKSKCYICNSQKKSCFKEDVQRCVNGCKKGGDTLSYDCTAYNQRVTPETSCDALLKKGQKFFGLFGDRSVYFQCVKISGKWYYYCYKCTPRSCYNQDRQICVLGTCDETSKPKGRMLLGEGMESPAGEQENEAAYPPQKQNMKTRCSKYSMKSYQCINEGYFPYPEDPTVYFNCTRGNDGTLTSKCRISLSCADYHSRGQKYFGISADKSVYFECEKIGEIWYHNCIECPSNQCFDQHKQQCEACHG